MLNERVEAVATAMRNEPVVTAFMQQATISDLLIVQDILECIHADKGISLGDWGIIQEALEENEERNEKR